MKRKKRQKRELDREALELLSLDNLKLSDDSFFVDITLKWKERQRLEFLSILTQYHGVARRIYCETFGLTETFVETTDMETLRVVAVNASVCCDVAEARGVGVGELRRSLLFVIMYGGVRARSVNATKNTPSKENAQQFSALTSMCDGDAETGKYWKLRKKRPN